MTKLGMSLVTGWKRVFLETAGHAEDTDGGEPHLDELTRGGRNQRRHLTDKLHAAEPCVQRERRQLDSRLAR